MKTGGTGGELTQTGLRFESRVDLLTLLGKIPGYTVVNATNRAGSDVYFDSQLVARCFKKNAFYKFLDEEGVNWKPLISKRILPDDAILVVVRDTLFIVEVKFQKVAGSVDEKLQTCDFKRKIYTRLVHTLKLRVEYVYVLNDWFKVPVYRDTLDYIHSVGCSYFFNELPLAWLGLPTGK